MIYSMRGSRARTRDDAKVNASKATRWRMRGLDNGRNDEVLGFQDKLIKIKNEKKIDLNHLFK